MHISKGFATEALRILSMFFILFGNARSDDMDWESVKLMVRNQFPSVSQISVDGLNTWILEDSSTAPVLLDVREPEEYAVSHLPDAVRARAVTDVEVILKDAPLDTALVLYCSVGYRSSELAVRLLDLGFTNVHNLEGSLFEWANAGLPLFRGTDTVSVVHPYDESWGTLVDREKWLFHPENEE